MGGNEDVAILSGYRSDELNVSYFDYYQSVFIGTTDGLVGIHFEYMYTSASHGIEYLWLEDGVLTRDHLIQLAASSPGTMSAMSATAPNTQDLAMVHIV